MGSTTNDAPRLPMHRLRRTPRILPDHRRQRTLHPVRPLGATTTRNHHTARARLATPTATIRTHPRSDRHQLPRLRSTHGLRLTDGRRPQHPRPHPASRPSALPPMQQCAGRQVEPAVKHIMQPWPTWFGVQTGPLRVSWTQRTCPCARCRARRVQVKRHKGMTPLEPWEIRRLARVDGFESLLEALEGGG